MGEDVPNTSMAVLLDGPSIIFYNAGPLEVHLSFVIVPTANMRILKRTYNLSSVQDQGNGFIILKSVSRLGDAGEGHI